MARPTRPIVEGHRGWRAAWPENTLAGFAAAARAGVDAVELDVGMTSDGVVAVCHDRALDPDLTRGPDGRWIEPPGLLIWRHPWAVVRGHDVGRPRPGGATARAFPAQCAVDGARVPMLAEIFELMAGHAVRLEVELKTEPGAPEMTADPAALADAVMAVAASAGAIGRLGVRSFDWRGLEHMARCWPAVPLTWLTDAETEAACARPLWRGQRQAPSPQCLADLPGATRAWVTWAPDHRHLTRDQVARALGFGLRVVPWTVNEASDVARLLEWGATGVCTDDPAMARAVILGLA